MERYDGIPLNEYDKRLKKVREKMLERNLESLLIYSEPNGLISSTHGYIRYLTSWSSVVPSLLIIPLEGEETLLTSLSFEAKRAKEITQLNDVRTVGDFIKEASKILKSNEKIGLIGMDVVPVAMFESLTRRFGKNYEDSSDILDRLRMIKSPSEIGLIRKACEICDSMFNSLVESISMNEPVRLAISKMEFEGMKAGAEISESFITNPEADYLMFNILGDLRFGDNYHITAGAYANYNGYWCQEIRMGIKNNRCEPHKEGYRIVRESQEAAFSLIKPGILINDVVERMFEVIHGAGFKAAIRMGHGIGLDYTERYISDCFQHPGINKELPEIKIEKNMVFEIHPNVWSASDGGFSAIGDVCLVTDTGVEILTNFSRELF